MSASSDSSSSMRAMPPPDVIKAGVDYIVDHNRDRIVKARASRIIKLESDGQFTVIRK